MANMGRSTIKGKNLVKLLVDEGVLYETEITYRISGKKKRMVIDMARCNPHEWGEYLTKAEESAKEHEETIPEDLNLYPVTIVDSDTLMWLYRWTPFTSLAYYISDAAGNSKLLYHEDLEMSTWSLDMTLKNGTEVESNEKSA